MMARIIPPRREELIISGKEVTQRYIKFFESLANMTSDIAIEVEDAVQVPDSASAARFASKSEFQKLQQQTLDQFTELRSLMNELVNARIRWLGPWQGDFWYIKNDLVIEDGWIAIANKDTLDHAAPQEDGEPISEFDNDPGAAFAVVNEPAVHSIAVGQRYASGAFTGWLREIRFFSVVASTDYFYDFYFVDANGNFEQVASSLVFESTGWRTIEAGERVINGEQFDILCIITNRTASTSTFNGAWNYVRSNSDPTTGQITHNSAADTMKIFYIDNNAVDQTANLTSLVTGDTITISGFIWDIIDIVSTAGSFITVQVSPQARISQGLYTATFTQYATVSTDYPRILNQYVANPDIDGFFDTDASGYPPTLDDNAYGIDILFQPAVLSADWDLLGFS